MFRSLGKSKIAFVLAILFGMSLFFFRGGERYSNLFNSDNVVASVSGTPISTTTFLRIMQMNINQYSQMFGRTLTSDEIQALQIHSMALGQLVNNAVFENEFDKKDFIIDETVIAYETKKRFPNLYNKDNTLNETALNAFLSQQNLKIDDVVKIIDYEARSQVFDKLFFNINYPKDLEVVINKHNQHTRNIDLIKFNINDFQLPNYNDLDVSINNNQIKDYFEQNINFYINPEKRNISYILIDKNNYKGQFTPSENAINSYYNDNKNLFLESEKRDFIQFNFKNIEEASEFRINIASLNTDEIKKFANENNIKFNKFSKVSSNEVLEELSNVIFELKVNEISEIIETPLAKHIVVINRIYPENQKTLNDSIKEITNTLEEVETDGFLIDLKNKISQQILDGYSINEIASENLLDINQIKNAKKQSDEIEDSLIKEKIISKGFQINKDFVSDIFDIDADKSAIINVDLIEEEKPYMLEEVFVEVLNDWITSLKIENLKKKIEETAKKSQSIDEISNYVQTKITNDDLQLDNINYPATLKNNVFLSEIGQIKLSVVDEEIYVSKLNKISFPENEINIQSISLLSELRSNFGGEIIKSKNISTNDSLIQALISQY